MKFHSKRLKNHLLSVSAFATFTLGTPGADVMSDEGYIREFIYGKTGNDVLVYTPSWNVGQTDRFDGGEGADTLWLRVTDKTFQSPAFQADLIRAYTFISMNFNVVQGDDKGDVFQFKEFNCSFRNIENIVIELISAEPDKDKLQKSLPYYPPMPNPSIDQLI